MPTKSFRGIRVFKFDDFELDVRAAELRRNGERVRLQEQPYRILAMLLERPGEVVLREEIRRRLWPNDTVVEVSHGINAAVLRLREALGDSAETPRYVETVARRGYRFRAAVETVCHLRRTSGPPGPTPEMDNETLVGQTVAHFRVTEKLGSGGMGVVYRAEDLKLGREVALKLLPGELARDPVSVCRFQREARAASALNHPNICTVHGVEEWTGQPVIVMELIEGETLSARLEKGPLTLEAAVPLAIQIAGALDAAHRKGVVHRDLKPSNVLLTREGPKVLDFGLEKMSRPGAGELEVTRDGAVLGTLHYMSPEQVQGKDVGPASDIFSFGLLLYEMLAGKRAFAGEHSGTVMAAILNSELPPLELAGPLAPILRRCLAKDPDDRWQSARDLKAALEFVTVAKSTPPRRWYWQAGVAAGLVAAVAVGWMLAVSRAKPDRPELLRIAEGPRVTQAIFPIANAMTTAIAPPSKVSLSPDGRTLAYLAGGRLFVRGVDSTTARTLDEIRGNGSPFWSPDGRFLAAVLGGKLTTVDVEGGKASRLWEVNTALPGTWGPDGSILIGAIGDGIWRVSAVTGNAERATELDTAHGETRHLMPQFLPDGRHFLFTAGSATPGVSALYVGLVGSKQRTRIATISSNASFVRTRGGQGYLLYLRDRVLMAQPFDAKELKITGSPFSVAARIATSPSMGAAVSVGDFTVSGDTLVYPDRGEIKVIHDWLSNTSRKS